MTATTRTRRTLRVTLVAMATTLLATTTVPAQARSEPQHVGDRSAYAYDATETDTGHHWAQVVLEVPRRGDPTMFVGTGSLEVDPVTGVVTETWWGWTGCGTLALTTGTVRPDLRAAWVDQQVDIAGERCTYDPSTDEYGCESLGTGVAQVTVSWTATGERTHTVFTDHWTDEYGRGTVTYNDRSLGADVVGGVTSELVSFDLSGTSASISASVSNALFAPTSTPGR